MNIIFFGSTSDSVIVVETLSQFVIRNSKLKIVCVVTQPPKPVGRMREITKTPVELWATENNIPVLSFAANEHNPWLYANEEDAVNAVSTFTPDLLISACYGQKIPWSLVEKATYGGLNVHPSLLPRWRGADPVPWTILCGDHQTGVSIVTLSPDFDQGAILAQKKIPVQETDYPDELRTRLFRLGADLLIETLPDYCSGKNKGVKQNPDDAVYARKLTRDDGFIPWDILLAAMEGKAVPSSQWQFFFPDSSFKFPASIIRMLRALSPWPGVWTLLRPATGGTTDGQAKKRLKILKAHVDHEKFVPDTVQLEGKNPVDWNTFRRAYITGIS